MATTDSHKLFSVEGTVVAITGGAQLPQRPRTDRSPITNVQPGIGLMMTQAFATAGVARNLHHRPPKRQTRRSSPSRPRPHYPPRVSSADVPVVEFRQRCMVLDPADWNNTFATDSTAVAFTSFAFLELAPGRRGPEGGLPGPEEPGPVYDECRSGGSRG
ncbi:hypothetical protein LTR74_006892 [Friedmanniomyces endolithicus]|nr:hypothetical protein LTR74_006892 [Friedmanniomyces endolithicus]